MRFVTFWFSYLPLFYHFCPLAAATLFNITVDDQFGDPTTGAHIQYTPPDAWSSMYNVTQDTQSLNISQIYNQSWHESLFTSNYSSTIPRPNIVRLATLTFTGSAVYITCILAPNTTNFTGASDMAFFLDGVQVGQFSHTPSSSTFKYHQIVYANTSLSMAAHSLIIQSGHMNGLDATIFLDSITYSTTTDPKASVNASSGTKGVSKAVIIGAVIGGLAVLPLCGLAFFLYRRQFHRHSVPMVQSGAHPNSVKKWRNIVSRATNFLSSAAIRRDGQVQVTPREGEQVMQQAFDGRSTVLEAAARHPPPPSHDPSAQWTHSITAWQRETHQAMQDLELAPPDMSEELSSYYDDATQTESRRPRTPPPPPRRFTVRNV